MTQTITATFILEILGRPPEHIISALNQLVDRIGQEKGVKIINKKVHEPKNLKDSQDLFTSFAEVEAEFEDLGSMFVVAFNYMPSNFEIIKPEDFHMKNNDFSGIITAILLRLHRYDEVAKKITMDKQILENKIREILRDFPEVEKKLRERVEEQKKEIEKKKKKESKKNS